MIRRLFKNLGVLDPAEAPEESARLERDGYVHLHGLLDANELAALRAEIDDVYSSWPAERTREDKEEMRYEMYNRSAACQSLLTDPKILSVIEPLLGTDCHVIANTAWRNTAAFEGGPWHCDGGPHVPRPDGIEWDDRIPYPVFAVAAHIYLDDCTRADGPTAVVPGSHRSGRLAPFDRMADEDLTYDGRAPVLFETAAGDIVLFVSDVWHRGFPAGPGGRGRYFLQVHYGRRDIAQRVRVAADANQVSPEAVARATTERERNMVGLHDPFFYDG